MTARAMALVVVSVVLEIIAQALPPYYSPIRDSESALAVGPYGALEIVSFCLRGGLVFILVRAAAVALTSEQTSQVGTWLLLGAGGAKFVIAFVATDLTPRPSTVHGVVHAVFAFASFFAAAIGEVLLARSWHAIPWLPARRLLRLGQITVVWSVVITFAVGMQTSVWGVLERIETALLLGWLVVFAAALRRHALRATCRSAHVPRLR